MSGFKKASRANQYLRMAIQGASGSGKTYSALEIAKYLAGPEGRIALIDTERSASLYSDVVDFDVDDDFGEIGKENYHQDVWKKKLMAAAQGGYKVVVLDSATHLWKGAGGFLAQIDNICSAQRAKGGRGDSFAAWKTVDPLYMSFMNFIRALPMHVIFCIRAKQAYEKVTDQGGKGNIKKVGVEPEYREGFEYEFDIQAAIDMDHVLVPIKHRLKSHLDGKVFPKPGQEFAEVCLNWLNSGAANAAKAEIEAEAAKKAAESTVVNNVTIVNEAPAANDVAPVVVQIAGTAVVPLKAKPSNDIEAEIANAENAEALNAIGKKIGALKKEKTIDEATYKALSKIFSDKAKQFKAAS